MGREKRAPANDASEGKQKKDVLASQEAHLRLLPLRLWLICSLHSSTTNIEEKSCISHKFIRQRTSMIVFGHPSDGMRQGFQIHVNERLHIESATEMNLENFPTGRFNFSELSIQTQE